MKKSKIQITLFETKNSLSEIYQTSKITFAFVSAPRNGYKQCHQFVKCRDFLQDAIRTMLTGSTAKIYGFEYDKAKNPPIDLRRTRLLVKSSGTKENVDNVILKAEKLVHHYENLLGLPLTAVTKHDDLYMFNGSNFWQFSPTMISFYTLLIRLAEYDFTFELYNDASLQEAFNKLTASNNNNNEISYLRSIKPFINKILANKHYIFVKAANYDSIYFKAASISTFHNGSGIVSLCTATDKNNLYNEAYLRLQNVITDDADDIVKLPVVLAHKNSGLYSNHYYSSTGIRFCISENSEEGNKTVTNFVTCREQLTSGFGKVLKEDKPNKYSLIMTIEGLANNIIAMMKHKQEVFFAKRVINFIEAKYGIKKTAVSTVCLQQEGSKFKHFGWLFSCSNEWLDSPVMLSLFTLIIRVVMKYSTLSEKIYKEVTDEVIDKICKFKKDSGSSYINKDFELLNGYLKHVDIILNNRKSLFFDKSTKKDNYYVSEKKIKELQKKSIYKSLSCVVGIGALLSKDHVDSGLVAKYKELCNAK